MRSSPWTCVWPHFRERPRPSSCAWSAGWIATSVPNVIRAIFTFLSVSLVRSTPPQNAFERQVPTSFPLITAPLIFHPRRLRTSAWWTATSQGKRLRFSLSNWRLARIYPSLRKVERRGIVKANSPSLASGAPGLLLSPSIILYQTSSSLHCQMFFPFSNLCCCVRRLGRLLFCPLKFLPLSHGILCHDRNISESKLRECPAIHATVLEAANAIFLFPN